MVVRVDNIGAMFLANNSVLSQQTKHISVRHHFIREYVEEGVVKIIFVKSKSNAADIFTKNLNQELFFRHVVNSIIFSTIIAIKLIINTDNTFTSSF